MSSSLLFALCCVSFLSGQLFNALCASLAASVNTRAIEVLRAVPATSGFSFQYLVVVVVSVLVVHDVLIVLLLRHLLQVPTPAIHKNIVKTFLLVVSREVFEWRNSPRVPNLGIAARHGTATPRNQFIPHRLLLESSIPRLLRLLLSGITRSITCTLVATFPRIEHLTAPALVSTVLAPTWHSRPRFGLRGPQVQAWQFVLVAFLALVSATASRSTDDVCFAFIEEVVEDESEGTGLLEYRSNAIVKAKIDAFCCKPYGFHAPCFPFIRHVSAAASLRKSPVPRLCYAVMKEVADTSVTMFSERAPRTVSRRRGCCSYSSIGLQVPQNRAGSSLLRALAAARFQDNTCQTAIEELAEDDSETTLVVEGELKSTNVEEKVDVLALRPAALPRPSYISVLRHLSAAATLRKTSVTFVVEHSVEEPCFATIEELADGDDSTLLVESVSAASMLEKKTEDVGADDGCEWDELPSYEEFVLGAPAEPLYKMKREYMAFDYGVCRPPPLSALADRTGVKPPPRTHTRGSRLPLLERLTARVKASALAEPASISV
ncbi:hypothetical protein B0H11DRAFT_2271990 [Mycena galericulata]|nr:hypothetical protein B0H11DRAFT_2271990 [Mycena galericulata]